MRVNDLKDEISRVCSVARRRKSLASMPESLEDASSNVHHSTSSSSTTTQAKRENNSECSSSDAADSEHLSIAKRSLSLDRHLPTPSLRRMNNSFRRDNAGASQVTSNRKLLQRRKESSNISREQHLSESQNEFTDTSSSETPYNVDSKTRSTRRAHSLRGERPRSKAKRRASQTACSTIDEQETYRVPLDSRTMRRGLRRTQSSIFSSEAAGTETSESSKSSSSTSSSSTNGEQKGSKRCSSLDRRMNRRHRGDQAPITPTRGPPSPITSDDSLDSPPQQQLTVSSLPPPLSIRDDALKDKPASRSTPTQTVVSTSRMKRNLVKQRSKRLLKSASESKIQVIEHSSDAPRNDQLSSSSSHEIHRSHKSRTPYMRTLTTTQTPGLPAVSQKSSKLSRPTGGDVMVVSERKKGNSQIQGKHTESNQGESKQRSLVFARLGKTYSTGGINMNRCTVKYPEKRLSKGVDDSTVRSNTDRTESTVSTSFSDFSSIHSPKDDFFSPIQTALARDPMSNFKSFSKLLSRLRNDFDLPTATEDECYHVPRRPVSMSSLMSHIQSERTTTLDRLDKRDADDDSTIVSTLEAVAPTNKSRSRSTSTSDSRIRRRRVERSSSDSKVVCFGNVNVREYERGVGDNPAVSAGVPIGLGWNYTTYLDVNVDIYEFSVRKPGPRSRKDFFLSPQDRLQILRDECGCTLQEITRAKESAAEARYQRQVSMFGEPPRNMMPTTSPPLSSLKRPPKGSYRRLRSTGSLQLPPLPVTDNRWDTSCPAVPSLEANQ